MVTTMHSCSGYASGSAHASAPIRALPTVHGCPPSGKLHGNLPFGNCIHFPAYQEHPLQGSWHEPWCCCSALNSERLACSTCTICHEHVVPTAEADQVFHQWAEHCAVHLGLASSLVKHMAEAVRLEHTLPTQASGASTLQYKSTAEGAAVVLAALLVTHTNCFLLPYTRCKCMQAAMYAFICVWSAQQVTGVQERPL